MSVVSTGEVAPRPKVTLDDAFRPVPKIVRGAETAPAPITVGDTVTDPVETTVTAFGIVFVPPSPFVMTRLRGPPSAVEGTATANDSVLPPNPTLNVWLGIVAVTTETSATV
jgi:hypothetical protein